MLLVTSWSEAQCLNNEGMNRALLAALSAPRVEQNIEETPMVTQIAATASAAPSPSPVDRPELSDVLALALGQDAVKRENGALTFDVNAFGVLSVARPEVLDLPSLYQRHERLRQFGVALTLGGQGLAVDADGDGQNEAAKTAENATDIVSFEGRWQFWGTRDPLDASSLERVVAKSGRSMDEAVGDMGALLGLLTTQLNQPGVAAEFFPNDLDCIDAMRFARFLESDEAEPFLAELRKSQTTLLTQIDQTLDEIEHSPVWTAFVGGTRRADGFGPDEERAGIRGAFGTTGHSWVLNLGWKRLDGLAGAADPATWTLGGEWIRQWKGLGTPSKQLAQISASLSGERFEDVPGAEFDEIVKVGVRLDYPIWENVVVPVSLTWANHASLIDDDDELVAHFGLSVDFKELLKAKK